MEETSERSKESMCSARLYFLVGNISYFSLFLYIVIISYYILFSKQKVPILYGTPLVYSCDILSNNSPTFFSIGSTNNFLPTDVSLAFLICPPAVLSVSTIAFLSNVLTK